jgi:hypothetical protein
VIALYISDTQISLAHYSRVHSSPLLVNITAVDLQGSLVEDLSREELAVNHLINGIQEANDKVFITGNEILISLTDALVYHEAFQTEQDMSDADIITLAEWKKDKRWGSTAEMFKAFIELYNDRRQGHIIYVHDFLIQAIKKILKTFSGSPVWLGTESRVLSALGNLPIMTIKLTGSHYDVFHMDRDNINGGTVTYGKSGLKCIDAFGNKSTLQQLLNEKFTMQNKPPWTICLDDLSAARSKHWERFKPQQPRLFAGVRMDDVKIEPDLKLDHKIVLSTMMTHPNINLGLNMFEPLGVVDCLYHEHESIAPPIEDEPVYKTAQKPTTVENILPAEDAEEPEPEKLVRKKRIGFGLPGQQNISFFRKQNSTRKIRFNLHWSNEQIISFLTALLLLGSFGGTIYYNEVIVSKVPRLEYEYINAVSELNEKIVVFERILPKITSRMPTGESLPRDEKIRLQSAAVERGLIKVFLSIEPGKLTYLSSSETILTVEFVGGETPGWQPEDIGLILATNRDVIDCCGGYKHYADIELIYTDLFTEPQGVELAVDAILSILKVDYPALRFNEQSPKKLVNQLQTPLIMQMEGEIQVRDFFSKVSGIASNLLIRKLIYKADPKELDATGTFYLSIIHPKMQPQQDDPPGIATIP